MQEDGGYPQELFTTPPNDIFNCSICLNIAKEPMRCPDEHIFCKTCIQKWLSKGKSTCPNDRKHLDKNLLSVFRTADAILGEYCMRCTASIQRDRPLMVVSRIKKGNKVVKKRREYTPNICSWVGKMKDFHRHKDACNEMVARCPHPDCSLKMLRRDLAAHAATCRHRLEPCKHCGHLRKPSKRSIHRRRCANFGVRCRSFHCKVRLPRGAMRAHEMVCPRAVIACPYAGQLNCTYKCIRSEMHKHTDDRLTHLEVTMQKVEEMDSRRAGYEDKLYTQEMLVQTLRQDLHAAQLELAYKDTCIQELQSFTRMREAIAARALARVEELLTAVPVPPQI